MEDFLKYEYRDGKRFIFPQHPMVKNWQFNDGEEEEAALCYTMAVVAEKNGVNANSLMHLFPACLRMLKAKGLWTE